MLAIPFHACTASNNEWRGAIHPILHREFADKAHTSDQTTAQAHHNALESELKRLLDLRQAAWSVRGGGVCDRKACEALSVYFMSVCYCKGAIGGSIEDVVTFNVAFRDAFNPSLVIKGKSFEYEKVAIMFNLGAAHSQMGATTARTSVAGIESAMNAFRRAAGAFDALVRCAEAPENTAWWYKMVNSGSRDTNKVCDLSPSGLKMCRQLMLAQAQACVYEHRLKSGNVNMGEVAHLAGEAAHMYHNAYNELKQSEELGTIDASWGRHLHFQCACFDAASYWWRAKGIPNSPTSPDLAIRRAYLSEAAKACTRALNPPASDTAAVLPSNITAMAQGLGQMVAKELQAMDSAGAPPAPATTAMPAASGTRLRTGTTTQVTPIDAMPGIRDAASKAPEASSALPFQALVPRVLREAVRNEWEGVRNEAHQTAQAALSLTSDAKKQLASMNLPLALDAYTMSRKVSDTLWRRIEAYQRNGGSDSVASLLMHVDELAENAKGLTHAIQAMITREEDASKRQLSSSSAANDVEGATVAQSALQVLDGFRRKIAHLTQAMAKGRDSDEQLRANLSDETWKEGTRLLGLTREQLEAELKRIPGDVLQKGGGARDRAGSGSGSGSGNGSGNGSGSAAHGSLLSSGKSSDDKKESLLDGSTIATPDDAFVNTKGIEVELADLAQALEARDAVAKQLMASVEAETGYVALMRSLYRPDTRLGARVDMQPLQARAQAKRVLQQHHDSIQHLAQCNSETATDASATVSATTALEAGGGVTQLTRAKQDGILSRLRHLNAQFHQQRIEEDKAAYGDLHPQVQKERERFARVIEETLSRHATAQNKLNEGAGWYTELTARLEKVLSDTKDHAMAQQLARGGTGTGSQQEVDDEMLALQLQQQFALEEQVQETQPRSRTASSSGGADMHAPSVSQTPTTATMATTIPPGLQPGQKIRVTLPHSGKAVEITVPPGAQPGQVVQFEVPSQDVGPGAATTGGVATLPVQPPSTTATAASSTSAANPFTNLFSAFSRQDQPPQPPTQGPGGPSNSSPPVYQPPVPMASGQVSASPATDSGAGAGTTGGQQPVEEVAVISADAVAQLVEMGFAEDSARAALIANSGDTAAALNALLTQDETLALRESMA